MKSRTALAALLAVAAASPSLAQTLSTGEQARSLGLGGGGIALPGPSASTQVNPAVLASPAGIRISLPRVSLAGEGKKDLAVLNNIIEHRDFDHLTDVGIGLLQDRTSVWTGLEETLRWDHFEIGIAGGGQLKGTPNESLLRFARRGVIAVPPPDARFVAEFGYQAHVPVAYGHRFHVQGEGAGDLDVGFRLTPVVGHYTRTTYRSDRRGKILHTRDEDAKGFNVGFDLGLRYRPKSAPHTNLGLVLRGLDDGAIGHMRRQTTFDVGVAREVSDRLIVTGDWLNVPGNAERASKVAAGAEYAVLKKWITVRGAVTSRGLAGGVSLGPLHFAYSQDGQSLLGTGFSF